MKEKKMPYQGSSFASLYDKDFQSIMDARQLRIQPHDLFRLIVEYFKWAEDNALVVGETASYQGEVTEHAIHKPRIFTISSLALFCGITESIYIRWRDDPVYADVIAFADSVIKEQKYQLAVNGVINPNLISKELGIDKPTTITVESRSTAIASTEQEMKAAVESVLDKI